MISRRGAVLSGLAAGLAGPIAAQEDSPREPDITIIGAGAAGIAASRLLSAMGVRHTVLEARRRLGGRAFTAPGPAGPFDHGAQWLHSFDRNPLARAAQRAGARFTRDLARDDRLLIGSRSATEAEEAVFAATLERLDDASGQGRDVAASLVVSPRAPAESAAAAVFGALELGVDLPELSLADAGQMIATGDERFVEGGLGALVARLGAGLPVRLGVAVRRLDWSGAGVRITTSAGILQTRGAIITAPTGLLAAGGISFTPALPLPLREAFEALPMGLLNKAVFALKPGAVPDGVHITQARAGGQTGSAIVHAGMAICFAGGGLARELERAGPREALAFHRAVLADAFGATALDPARPPALTAWGQDPWAKGSYSAARPGKALARQAAQTLVGGRLAFAGEAWAGPWATQAGGAWLTGERAARLLARALRLGPA